MPISRSTLEARLRSAQQAMAQQSLSALLVYAQGSTLGPATKSHGYMRYLCDWDSHQNASVLLLRPEKPPTLLVTNIFATFYTRQYHWIEDVRFVKAPEVCALAARILADEGAANARLGLVGRAELPVPGWERLAQGLPGVQWVDFTPVLDAQRLVKDPEQLAVHQDAARICDSMFETLRREIHTPRPGYQLQAEMERTARYAGAEYCMTWLTVGPQADYSRFFRQECERTPQPGDQVIAGIYLMFEGHWAHAIRSGTMGPASAAHREVFGIASDMADAMQAELRPGGDLHRVQGAAEGVLRQRFPPEQLKTVFRFRHGHALGLSYEDPVSSAAFPQVYDEPAAPVSGPMPAKPGMLFELHPNLFVPGLGGAAIGDMVLVGDEGTTHLTRYPRELADWTA